MSGLSDNIKMLRRRYSLTQEELGSIAGVSDKAVSTWENSVAEPRMGAVRKIADHFGIPISEILDYDDSTGMSESEMDDIVYVRMINDNETIRAAFEAMKKNPRIAEIAVQLGKLSNADMDLMVSLLEKMTSKNRR